MILSDNELNSLLKKGDIVVAPLIESNIQGASIDLTLDNNFLKLKDHSITHISINTELDYTKIVEDTIVIAPHSFILASSVEYLEIPASHACIVEGRSSVGRIGLFIQNAGLISPGFKGNLTLELYNANNIPLQLTAGMKICQILFIDMSSKPSNSYKGKYQGQKNVTGSKITQDTITIDNKTEDTLYTASDHAGFDLKENLISELKNKNIPFKDCGTFNDSSVDYPDYASIVAKAVSSGKIKRGVLICGSGVGMYITANRYKNVRAALCNSVEEAILARKHDDINILVLAGRVLDKKLLPGILAAFLNTEFEMGRHERRVKLIDNL